jgi:phosphatidylserine/phosphatidylglycerophosphate/cardiolipin synthase-like enzyme
MKGLFLMKIECVLFTMATFLDTQNISSEIANLIKNSKQRLYLITPYLQLNKQIKPYIKDLVYKIPNIDIIVVCRSDKINVEDMSFLQDLKNVKIWALDNLHAKCYINEETAIITSMNLYQYSEGNNYEMGIKIDKTADEKIFEQISDYISIIMRESKKYEIKQIDSEPQIAQKSTTTTNYSKQKNSPSNKIPGFCIHCGEPIEFTLKKPLCLKCYHILGSDYKRSSPERFCLACGKKSYQTFEKPICQSCEKKISK